MAELVLYEVNGPVATVTLNRPDSMNTMNPQLLREALLTLERVAGDEAVRVVILTGSGRAFCAGGDLANMAMAGADGTSHAGESMIDCLRHAMRTSQVPAGNPQAAIA